MNFAPIIKMAYPSNKWQSCDILKLENKIPQVF